VPLSPVSLAGATFVPPDAGAAARSPGTGAAPFADLVDHFVGGAVRNGVQADQAVRDFALGRTDGLHEVMLQVAQADLSFHLILEMRNRLTDAYQEIMKMQV
jgi:flagellar hook-basal body complex protein FliE